MDIRSGVRTQRIASQNYNTPRSAIINNLKTNMLKKMVTALCFLKKKKVHFRGVSTSCAVFGFPGTDLDLRYSIECYLDR